MTIKSTGSLSFKDDLEAEFGPNPGRSLGQYRREDPSRVSQFNPSGLLVNSSPDGSSLSNLPLDVGVPNNGEIKFSDFYGKKLNMVVDYYSGSTISKQTAGNNTMAASWRFTNSPSKVKVVGGFRSKPSSVVSSNGFYNLSSTEWQNGKRVLINVNKTLGGRRDNSKSDVALRTGTWPSGTELQVDVGASGEIRGAGGDGGAGAPCLSCSGGTGGSGTSALGIGYPTTIVNNGLIRCGYGGGGGGSGAGNDPSDKSDTDYGRSGAGGGGGAGLPAGSGGAGGGGGFSGSQPINGGPGFDGSINSGGNGGTAGAEGGATGGPGGAGGDFNDAPVNGTSGQRTDGRAYTNTPGPLGPAGTDGRAVIFSSNFVQQNSSFTGNSVDGRNGGAEIGGYD